MRSASAQRNPGRIGVFLARSLGAGFSLPRVLIRCLVAATFEAVGLASKLAFEAVGLASQLCTILSKLTMAPVTLSLAVLGARGGVNQLVLAAATGAVYTVGGCEGLRRSVSFNAHMAPLVLHYKVVQADLRLRRVPQPDRASRYDVMHAQYAAVPLGVALRLGGFYVKICQVMSAFDGIVPRAYTDALRVLQDAVPARPASYVRQLIEQVCLLWPCLQWRYSSYYGRRATCVSSSSRYAYYGHAYNGDTLVTMAGELRASADRAGAGRAGRQPLREHRRGAARCRLHRAGILTLTGICGRHTMAMRTRGQHLTPSTVALPPSGRCTAPRCTEGWRSSSRCSIPWPEPEPEP
jgi:hypothetical protein